MKYITQVGEHAFEIEIEEPGTILVDGQPLAVDLQEVVPDRLYSLLLDNVSYESFVQDDRGSYVQVLLKGHLYHVQIEDERTMRLAHGLAGFTPASGEIPIKAPMPGLIVSVPVRGGQAVQEGEVLVILESMKMDNELRAPRDGAVARVHVEAGDSVESRQTLVTLA
ncbi:MAG: acetyl-CoA carboxylase biotin carboxyl carrier protein subunit [Anaerolineae bacterium]|jgi:biotin carboxyl carrier protein